MLSGEGKKKPVTITEIAQQAGVTAQTVSYVLSNNPNVKISDGTRRLVNRIAQELGYRPNRLAQAMKSGKMQMIGLWVPLTGRHSRSAVRFLAELHKYSREGDHDTLLFDVKSDTKETMSIPPEMGWPVDGVVGFDCLNAFKLSHQARNLPKAAVLVGSPNPYIDSICWDLRQGYQKLTESLMAKGARNIGFLTRFDSEVNADLERSKGVLAATEGKSVKLSIIESGDHAGQLSANLRPYLAGTQSLDAIIACCDSSALGAMREISKAGLTLGQDIYLGSYGDSFESGIFPPCATCLSIPFEETAMRAWHRLRERLEGRTGPAEHINVPMAINEPVSSR